MPLVKLSDLPHKIPDANDLVLIESGGSFYSSTVADLLPPFVVAAPVDLSVVTDPVYLAPGYAAYRSFTNATSVQLPISVVDFALYSILCFIRPVSTSATSGLVRLTPNDTPITNGFSYSMIITTTSGYLSLSGNSDGLVLTQDMGSFSAIVSVDPNKPTAISFGDAIVSTLPLSYNAVNVSSYLSNGTITWSTLGTLVFPHGANGVVLVRREA